jgi:hypothetical protein
MKKKREMRREMVGEMNDVTSEHGLEDFKISDDYKNMGELEKKMRQEPE